MIARTNIPLHEQIRDDIQSKINDSIYKQDEKIPSERVLAEQYGVSRVTIRNTINDLVHLGVLYRRHGSGTFVKKPDDIKSHLNRMTSVFEQLENLGMDVRIELISEEYVEASEAVQKALQLKPGDKVYRILRKVYASEEPLLISYVHTHVEVGKKLENINMNKAVFLTSLEDFGYQIQYAEEKIRAIRASELEREVLKIHSDTPLLSIERTVFTANEKPLYIVKDRIIGDRYSLHVILQRNL